MVVYLGDNIYPRGLPDTGAPGRREALRRLDCADRPGPRGGGAGDLHPRQSRLGSDGGRRLELDPPAAAPHRGARRQSGSGCFRRRAVPGRWWWTSGSGSGSSRSTPSGGSIPAPSRRTPPRSAGPTRRTKSPTPSAPISSGPTRRAGWWWSATIRSRPAASTAAISARRDYFFPLRHVSRALGWIPLPGLGAIYPEARASGISSQDIPSGSNRRMREALEGAMLRHRPLVWASGHDHNLQVLAGRTARHLLVSGSGIFGHGSRVVQLSATRYASAASGYMRLDVLLDGRVRLGVIQLDGQGRRDGDLHEVARLNSTVYSATDRGWMMRAQLLAALLIGATAPLAAQTAHPPRYGPHAGQHRHDHPGQASTGRAGCTGSSSAPTTATSGPRRSRCEVLDLATFDGGLTPTRKGGGKQTKSLRFKSKDGPRVRLPLGGQGSVAAPAARAARDPRRGHLPGPDQRRTSGGRARRAAAARRGRRAERGAPAGGDAGRSGAGRVPPGVRRHARHAGGARHGGGGRRARVRGRGGREGHRGAVREARQESGRAGEHAGVPRRAADGPLPRRLGPPRRPVEVDPARARTATISRSPTIATRRSSGTTAFCSALPV